MRFYTTTVEPANYNFTDELMTFVNERHKDLPVYRRCSHLFPTGKRCESIGSFYRKPFYYCKTCDRLNRTGAEIKKFL